jgi:hypothetical protein
VTPAISVLCPTRGRPASARRVALSALETAAGDAEVVFYCDDDAAGSVPAGVAAWPEVTVVTGPRIVMSDMWNKCLEKASGDIVMQCADDIVFRTAGWDRLVLEAFAAYPDRIALVYGDDLIHGEALATHSFAHRRWTDATGYFTPPWFSCDYSDAWLYDVAKAIGRLHYLPGLVTEHLHPVAGKGDWDASHRERLERGRRDNVAVLYESLAARREQDAGKLRAVMGKAV